MGQNVSLCSRGSTRKSVPKRVEPLEEAAPPSGEEPHGTHTNELQTSENSYGTHTNELQTSEKYEIQEVENLKIVDTGTLETSPRLPQLHHVTDTRQASENREPKDVEYVKIVTPKASLSAPKTQDQDYVKSPLVLDKETIDYVKRSRVMVILKGLPGSGKSRIARRIAEVYEDTVICSADDYFIKDGKYKFDQDELSNAHESCQKKALDAAQEGRNVIVIDNTNIRAWESKHYLHLAGQYQYVPLILEACTPWAFDPNELVKWNSHGLTIEILERKVKDYQKVLPLYYWWYLNKSDSNAVMTLAQEWLRKALNVHQFYQDFSSITKLSTVDDMLKYYGKSQQSGGYGLHATACVTRRGKEDNAMKYINSEVVKKSMGRCFSLHIIGYVITPRAFGARLRLGESALELWGMNDNEIEQEERHSDSTAESEKKRDSSSNANETQCKAEELSNLPPACVDVVPSQMNDRRFHPTSGKGSRAHLTLGCAAGVHAKVTGFDLIKVISHEQEHKNEEDTNEAQKLERYDLPNGVLTGYGEGVWVVYPEEEVVVRSLFSGYY